MIKIMAKTTTAMLVYLSKFLEIYFLKIKVFELKFTGRS